MNIATESPSVIEIFLTLPKEIVVNKLNQSRNWKWGLVLIAVVVTTLAAATTWAAPPAGKKDDNAVGRGNRNDNPPPPANRQNDGPSRQQSQRPPDPVPKSVERHHDVPVNREATGSATRNRNIESGNSSPVLKNADSKSIVKQLPPKDTKAADAVKDNVIKGGKGDLRKQHDLPLGKSPNVKGSSIDDVRKRLDRSKDIHVQPKNPAVSDAMKRQTIQKNAFQERLKKGDLDRVTAGKTAKQLNLANQYRMYQKGDVARRLDLEKHGPHPTVYHGVVSPLYKNHCMKYAYWGPAFFAGVCLYPHWNPWVEWSWHHHCPPYWDPRPYWCRPVIYQPCPVWVYWETPVWTPLPEAACGTWVDLKPVVLPPDDADLQLVAVRFVDPGHPEEKLGPRYRVWFRNNGSQPIGQPFNVMLFAGNDEQLAADTPQAGVRVTGIEPAGIQSVDIRLPMEVYEMGRDAHGKPAPFSVLQVLVDANQEIGETTKANNGARLAPAEILPVDPASFELQPKAAKAGEEILLAGEGFGPQPGRVLVQVNGQEIDGEILGWYDLGVQWTLPKLALAAPVEADVIVIRGDGAAANPIKITITP
jgi:hypothetical protein